MVFTLKYIINGEPQVDTVLEAQINKYSGHVVFDVASILGRMISVIPETTERMQ